MNVANNHMSMSSVCTRAFDNDDDDIKVTLKLHEQGIPICQMCPLEMTYDDTIHRHT